MLRGIQARCYFLYQLIQPTSVLFRNVRADQKA
jgi:hypothetical protein